MPREKPTNRQTERQIQTDRLAKIEIEKATEGRRTRQRNGTTERPYTRRMTERERNHRESKSKKRERETEKE